jgi:phosphatidylglycerol---prolipoprotein diacylglyceryl transferase
MASQHMPTLSTICWLPLRRSELYPFLLEIGPLRIPSFGVMVTTGFLVSLFVLRRELIRKSFDPALAESLAMAAMISGLIGAKVYFIFEVFSYFVENPIGTIFSGAGFTFFGGLIGGTVGILYVIRRHHLPVLPISDALALIVPLGYALGRIGCQLAGDGDYGMPTDLPWGMAYPDGIVPTMERVHPTPVYETLQSLVIFGWLMRCRHRFSQPGMLLYICLILLGLSRFWVEFFRINPEVFLGLSDAQVISILMVLGGAAGWLNSKSKDKQIG